MGTDQVQCWCGNRSLSTFSPDYLRCTNCGTLVLAKWPGPGQFQVTDDSTDFYGKQYYDLFVRDKYGYPSLADRSRLDLPERCLHWLKTLLKYKLPPGSTLELGCAHGGFVALLNWAGFHSTGLELSPWIVKFAKDTFAVPILTGPVEDQQIVSGSLDCIVLMDVLEHFPDPKRIMRYCLDLLKDDGVVLVQTPRYPALKTFEELSDSHDKFLLQLKPDEHIYLFSEQSVKTLFSNLGAEILQFEPAIFSHYDMFLAVSRTPLVVNSKEEIERSLLGHPSGRLILAMLDLDARLSHRAG